MQDKRELGADQLGTVTGVLQRKSRSGNEKMIPKDMQWIGNR